MTFNVFYLVFIFFLVNSIEGGCDNGWYQLTTVTNKCIKSLNPQTGTKALPSCSCSRNFANKWLSKTNNPYDNFIGLNCVQTPFNWVWADGEPVKYTHFLAGFPTNETGNYCVYMLGDEGQWVDGACNKDITGSICQYLY